MNFWEGFWQIVLLVSVIGFAVLAVVVTYGGLSDIRAMLRKIETRHDEASGGHNSPATDCQDDE